VIRLFWVIFTSYWGFKKWRIKCK